MEVYNISTLGPSHSAELLIVSLLNNFGDSNIEGVKVQMGDFSKEEASRRSIKCDPACSLIRQKDRQAVMQMDGWMIKQIYWRQI